MAAFCACCGAEITLKAEACSVCGTPRHGMLRSDRSRDATSPLSRTEESFLNEECDSSESSRQRSEPE